MSTEAFVYKNTLWILFCFWLFLCASIPACFSKKVTVAPWPSFKELPEREPQRIIQAFNERTPDLQSIRAKISVEVLSNQGSGALTNRLKLQKFPKFTGDLALQKPDRVRLRTYTPMGAIAFDLLYTAKHVELYLPNRKELVIVPLADLDQLKLGTISVHLPQSKDWWRIVQPWPKGSQKNEKNISLSPGKVWNQALLSRPNEFLSLNWKTGRIESIQTAEGRTFQYQAWQFLTDYEYASHITVTYRKPQTQDPKPLVIIHIILKKILENPEFPPPAFQSVDTSQLKITHLGEEEE